MTRFVSLRSPGEQGLPVAPRGSVATETKRLGSTRSAVTAATVVACATLLVAPLIPGALATGSPSGLVGLPVESLVVVLVLVAAAAVSVRAIAAALFGAVVVAAILVAALDLGFRATVDRPFSLAEDGGALVSAFGVVEDTTGTVAAILIVAVLAGLAVAAAVGLARAALRVGRTIVGTGDRGLATVAFVTAAWVVCSLAGTHLAPGAPVAASASGDALLATSLRAVTSIQEQRAFELAVATDRYDAVPGDELLSALAGKDVVIAFVESYGRVAVEESSFTRGIHRALEEGGALLARNGYAAQSAFLTSPTFGGVSWLAHATLQSGVWVDSQPKYDRLVSGDRLTLSRAFEAAGWRTVAVVPSNDREWETGTSFYGLDSVLDSRDLGYRGPEFGYARMPDQYTWQAFRDRELAEAHAPLMAEIDLVSSHTPWTPLPEIVPWAQLGDGTVFAPQAVAGEPAVVAWADPERVRELYGESVEYSLETVFSFLETYDQPDLVLVLVGDHQPARVVSGPDAGHDVPVTIISKDPEVFAHLASWRWDAGVHPSPDAPVWRMDEFRDRFFAAFSG